MIKCVLLAILACVLSEPAIPLFPNVDGITHWSIGQEGKIQMQLPSQFALRRPHDFVNFIQQERRLEELRQLEQELLSFRYRLHQFQSMMGQSDLPLRSSDPDCRAAELPLSAYNLHLSSIYPLSSKGIREETYIHPVPKSSDYIRSPRCRDLPLFFSMHAMEHLVSVADRNRLHMQPEVTISGSMRYPVDEWGDMVYYALDRNLTSWVLLNQAAVYWRVKGEATEAVECLRRALHFSRWENKDVALLNLANVQHLSGHSQDAVVSLRQALEITPTSGIIHYMLGNVYASLKQYNNSALHYYQCHEVQPSFAAALSQYKAALCEMKIKKMLEQHSRELNQARVKLDEFYKKHDEMQKHQQFEDMVPQPPLDNLSTDGVESSPEGGLGVDGGDRESQKKEKDESKEQIETIIYEDLMEELDQQEVKEEPKIKRDLEDIEEELREITRDIDEGRIEVKGTIAVTKYVDEKRVAKKKRQLEEELESISAASSAGDEGDIHTSTTVTGSFDTPEENCKVGGDCRGEATSSTTSTSATGRAPNKPKIILTPVNKTRGNSRVKDVPYADGLFPVIKRPLPPVHDTNWPGFSSCMDFDQQLSSWKKITSTMIDPATRAVSFEQVFKVLPQQIPDRHHTEPYCSHIIDLPYSMMAMDHLPGVQMRTEYESMKGTAYSEQEPVLIKILSKSADRKKEGLLVNQLGEKVYKAMLRRGPNWVLFNLAALYWRIVGVPQRSIECLRLAIHMCPRVHKDVGLVGLANVMRKIGRLEDALKAGQAALDVNFDEPVTHYTLAIVLSSLSDYNTSMLHLKFALMLDKEMGEAEELLKALKCIELLKKEKDSLERELKLATMTSCDKKGEGCNSITDSVTHDNSNHDNSEEEVNTNLFSLLDGHRRDLISDIRKYFKKLEDPRFEPGKRLFPPGLSLARGGGPISEGIGQFEQELEDALLKSSSSEINITYWTTSWPTAEECAQLSPLEPFTPVSVALLPTDKGISLSQYIELGTKFSDGELTLLPFCKEPPVVSESAVSLDHFAGVSRMYYPDYKAESTLMEDFLKAFQPVDYTLEEASSRLRQALDKNASCWVANVMAGVYWRVTGNGEMSVRCLKAALQTAPAKHRDVVYQNLAFILAKSGYLENATEVIHMGLRVAPKQYLSHYTMAVVMYQRKMLPETSAYLENTLNLKADPPLNRVAASGLRAVKCALVVGQK